MLFTNIRYKIRRRTWSKMVRRLRSDNLYPKIYKSFWHACYHKPRVFDGHINYYSAVPNRGAGIGHQLGNWIAGYWYAKQFGLKFAHIPFAQEKWESFLGFGNQEITVKELVKKHDFKKVLLPLFDEDNQKEIALIKKIIHSYCDQKVVFIAEQDQFYRNQFGVMVDIKRKFYQAEARANDHLIYSKDFFNIAVHVRRGDIMGAKTASNRDLLQRWQDTGYFEKVLATVIENLQTGKPIAVYIFSQGERNDFPEFERFKNVHFCLNMNARDSFLLMVKADLLITSKSSFSYKPALLSNGIKLCPGNFWHGYPDTDDWILVRDDGTFNVKQLQDISKRLSTKIPSN